MRKFTKSIIIIFFLILQAACAFADPVSTLSKPIATSNSFKVESSMGMASYSIPIEVPPGRRGMQPQIILEYSSNNPNSWLGMGWNLNLGYIEKSMKRGVPKYDSSDNLYISFREFRSDMRKDDRGIYWPDECPSYLKLIFDGTYWKGFDNQGNTYYFGQTDNARISSPEKGIFRWALDKIVDSCGNYLSITYQKVEGQIYPLKIEYAGNEITGDLPTNKVQFFLEDRNDFATGFHAGFPVATSKRLSRIDTFAGEKLAKRYVLEYKYSTLTNRSLLTKVTTHGSDGITALPAQTFSYQEEKTDYIKHINNSPRGNVKWVTRNGKIDSDFFKDVSGVLYPNGTFSSGGGTFSNIWWNQIDVVGEGTWTWANDPTATVVIDAKGSFNISMKKQVAMYYSTYLYVNSPKTITIPASGNCNARYFLNGDHEHPYEFSTPLSLKEGYNLLEITGYNRDEPSTLNLNFPLTDYVDAMNSYEMVLPQISGDFNGDGKSDLAEFHYEGGDWWISHSTGDNFMPKKNWGSIGLESGAEPGTGFFPFVGDWNGDGKTDAGFYSRNSSGNYWWNFTNTTAKGDGFGDSGSLTQLYGANSNDLPVIADFNGDNICDKGYYDEDSGDWYIFLSGSNGRQLFISGFGGNGWEMHLGDFNGDGLTDAAVSDKEGNWKVALCDGKRFIENGIWVSGFGKEKVLTSADFNYDGLCDIGYLDKEQGKVIFRASTGEKFNDTDEVLISGLSTSGQKDISFQAGDFNGDGLLDPYAFNPASGYSELAYSNGKFYDLLVRIENGMGGSVSITYTPSTQYDNKQEIVNLTNALRQLREGLPINIPLVSKIEVSDGMMNKYLTSYSYKGGLYNYYRKEFLGFNYILERDSDGNITETYYDQQKDFADQPLYKMKPLKIEKKDGAGKLYEKTEYIWSREAFGGGGLFSDELGLFNYIYQEYKYKFDEDGNSKQIRMINRYDDYGNLLCTGNIGEYGSAGDESASGARYTYNAATNGSVISKPYEQAYTSHSLLGSYEGNFYYLFDALDRPVKWFFYDNNIDYKSPATKGLLTKEVLAGDNSYSPTSAKNSVITYKYDPYGNIIEIKDAGGGVTLKVYDTAQTFPVETTNALGYKTKTTYDAHTGEVLTVTDANNQTTKNIYDTLGRLVKVVGPYDTMDYPGIIYEYDLSKCPAKITTRRKISNNPASLEYPDYLVTYSFYDGLGRLIQTKSPAENDPQTGSSRQIISDIVKFDSRGQVKEKYFPYFVNVSSNYVTPTYDTALASFTYDAIGRLIQTTNPDGTYSTVSYSDWTRTIADENGHQRRSTYDGLGRLVKQEEFNDTQVYTTTYKYSELNDIIEIKDDRGNITTIAYDPQRRKISMSDPDMGVWTYEYDKVGNLIKQTDAKNQVLEFTYDVLNRLTGKLSNGQTLVTYLYDNASKSNCIGRLSKITDLSGPAEFFYDNLGRETKSVKTVTGSGSYTVERIYDALDRLVTLKYPDSSVVKYEYNPQGIEKTYNLSPTTYDLIKNIDYSPTGQITKIVYGNGTESNYTYDPKTLRLTNLITQSPYAKIQDLNYQFDNVGNIKNITDYVNTATQSFLYDDLNRLIQAQGSYGTHTYDYDSIGNMIYKEGVSLTYGKNGRLPHAVTQYGNILIDYDANGNMISKGMSPEGGLSLTYDVENRLTKVEDKSATQPQTVTLTLTPGWNFISFPMIPVDAKISSVLASIAGKYDQVSRYNSTTKKFEHYVGNPKYDQFNTFEYGKGYQIYITASSDVTLSINGTIPTTTQSIALKTGYNLIFNPKTTDTDVETALLPLKSGVDYSKVLYYNKSLGKFQEYSLSKKEFTTLKPGVSYYLYCLKDTIWTITYNSPTTTFVYDGDGGRVKKTTASGSNIYIGSLFENDSLGKTTKHIFAGSNRICAVDSTGSKQYYHSDHLGSSNIITDKNGNQVGLTEFTPYGSISKQTGSYDPKHKFTGKELDNTGLYFYGARYYDPKVGRFITADPIVPGTDKPALWVNLSDVNPYTKDAELESKKVELLNRGYVIGLLIDDVNSLVDLEGNLFNGYLGFQKQATGIIPKNPQDLNRYTYSLNNPLRYIDPTGYSWQDTLNKYWDYYWNWTSTLTLNTINWVSSSLTSYFNTINYGFPNLKSTPLLIGGLAIALEPTQISKATLIIGATTIGTVAILEARSSRDPRWYAPGMPGWRIKQYGQNQPGAFQEPPKFRKGDWWKEIIWALGKIFEAFHRD